MSDLISAIEAILRDVLAFAEYASGLRLRKYQEPVARAIADSVFNGYGDTIVVMFPRQSGKNETQAQLETYLLTLYSQLDNAEMVKASPTWRPQSLNAMRRLERVLKRNLIARDRWQKEAGYIFRVGGARIFFFSAAPTANIVGATASLLLEVDEAQDVNIPKYDKDLAPMAASTNATRVFWGTAWTSQTLLARELRAAREAEAKDGRRRAFVLSADDVSCEVPAYGEFVKSQVAKLGRNHPMVKTQFYSEEIDASGGMFPAERRALMQGDHVPALFPAEGKVYALLVDVAGEDEAASFAASPFGERDGVWGSEGLSNPGRDSTSLTVVEVDLSSLAGELIRKPTYRVVYRQEWIGVKHSSLYGAIKAIFNHWKARYLVIDATGVGAGLASFLSQSLGEHAVIPFVFTNTTKSKLGWDFLAIVETGRFKDHSSLSLPGGGTEGEGIYAAQSAFFTQLEFCKYEAGLNQSLKWSVPDGQRHPVTGEILHDDWIMSAALTAVLDEQPWGVAKSEVIEAPDILEEMGEVW
jgi:hypothetical protein